MSSASGSPPSGAGRRRPWHALAALAALALVAVALVLALGRREEGPAPERAITVVQDDAVLLHGDDAQVARALDDLRSLGVDWVRVTAGWSTIAPARDERRAPRFDAADPGAYPEGAWRSLDRVAALAAERELALAIDVAFWAPAWAVSRPLAGTERQRDGVDPEAFGAFAEAVARRYPRARAFTVWNEPNFKSFLLPQWRRERGGWVAASPHAYRELVRAAVPRIRAAAPGALVLIGGTAAGGDSDPDAADDGVPPLRFVRELACVDERLEPLDRPECERFAPLPGDGFAHHPISFGLPPWEPDPARDNVRVADLDRLVKLLRRLHARGRTERELPVYVTEYGYQTNPPDPTQDVSPAEQAAWLPHAERIALTQAGVRSWAQFLLRDLGPRPGATPQARWRDSQMGLRFEDGRPKPAERAFALALALRRAGGGLSAWARVRAARAPTEIRIARRERGGWRPVESARTDERGIALLGVHAPADGVYRLEARAGDGWRAGPPVRPR